MNDWKDLGSNIIKLEGYGLYITYIDDEYYQCEMSVQSGMPPLDPDGCISWDKLVDPPNQKFLNLLNARFKTGVTMTDFDKQLTISEVKEYVEEQRKQKKVDSDASLQWLVKNMRERDK